jgi:hypothetical protein
MRLDMYVIQYPLQINLPCVKFKKKTPWPEFASEIYRPSDRRLSAKLMPTFAGWRVPRGQRDGSLRPYSRLSKPETSRLLKGNNEFRDESFRLAKGFLGPVYFKAAAI